MYIKTYSQCISFRLQLNLKFHGCRYNRNLDMSVKKKSYKSMKAAPPIERYELKLNVL